MRLLKVANNIEHKLNKKADYHNVLDLLGLIPGVGEIFDAANALAYAVEGNWLYSILSIISIIPEVGDIIGKSPKLIVMLDKLESEDTKKYIDFIKEHKDDVMNAITKIKSAFLDKKDIIIEKVEDFINDDEKLKEKYADKLHKIKLELNNIEDILEKSDNLINKIK